MLTQQRLQELLDYDPETGVFTRKVATQRLKEGDVTGGTNSNGYLRINVDGRSYKAHRLVWLYVHGTFPVSIIHHANGIRTDNRLVNLIDSTYRGNNSNRPEHRHGHLVGTHFRMDRNKWVASLKIEGKHKHLGYFLTQIEAHLAYQSALQTFDVN